MPRSVDDRWMIGGCRAAVPRWLPHLLGDCGAPCGPTMGECGMSTYETDGRQSCTMRHGS
eukprot:5041222-Prymnesium_polylepis.2